MEQNIAAAIQQWSEILGQEHVLSDEKSLSPYTYSTVLYSTRPLAVLHSPSTEEVAAIGKIAGLSRIPLYPISRGKNWGYGVVCASPTGRSSLRDRKRGYGCPGLPS